MTAYGRQGVSTAAGEFTWEIRSVNNRYLETTVRMPEDVRALEPKIREAITRRLSRGKIEVSLRRQGAVADDSSALTVNANTVNAVIAALAEVTEHLPTAAQVNPLELLQWPGVLTAPEAGINVEDVHKALLKSFDQALTDFVATREREGEAIDGLLRSRIVEIRECVESVRVHRPDVVNRQRERLKQKLAELDIPSDSHRLEQEILYVAQRLDIDEELDRLGSHLSEVESVLERSDPVGRRLDFLMQELNREANTLGSKSNDIDTTGASVDIKVLIEQMREQVQNVE